MKEIFAIFLILPTLAFAKECNKDIALKNGIEAIKEKYPSLHKTMKPFVITEVNNSWAVLKESSVNPKKRGGGSPEAKINKTTCEVERVSLSR